jgi:hypothetical protein
MARAPLPKGHDILPADHPVSIDDDCRREGSLLLVIVRAILLEQLGQRTWDEGIIEPQRILSSVHVLVTSARNGYDLNVERADFLEVSLQLPELIDTGGSRMADVEDQHHMFLILVIGRGDGSS